MNRYIWIVAYFLLAGSSFGAEPDSLICGLFNDKSIAELGDSVEKILRHVPQVPPDEIAYLYSEQVDIFKSLKDGGGSKNVELERRFDLLRNRRLYYSWKARVGLLELKESIHQIIAPSGIFAMRSFKSEDANKISRAINVFSPLHSASEDLSEFYRNERSRSDALISSENVSDGKFQLLEMVYRVTHFAACKLSRIAK